MELREYQKKAIVKIREAFLNNQNAVILQLPTGGGKTVIFSEIAKQTASKGNSVLVITDRVELLKQAGGTFEKIGITANYLTSKTKQIEMGGIWVAMVETIKRRLHRKDYVAFVQSFDLIIIDEAHKQSFNRIFEAVNEKQRIIGATATPYRSGSMKPLKNYYDTVIVGEQIPELISTDFLSPAVHYGVPIKGINSIKITAGEFDQKQVEKLYDDATLYGGVIKNYVKHCNNKKALLFTASIANSVKLVAEFNKNGIDAIHIDGETPKPIREQILLDFKNGKYRVLSNVGVLTTGYDEPSIEVIITYRPTRSLPLWLQMCGRGSRIFEGKEAFIILDFGENTKRHGFWDAERTWTLDLVKPPKKKGIAPIKECPNCGALVPVNAQICEYCQHEFPQKKAKSPIEVVLEKLTPGEINRADWNVYELEEIRKIKGYKVGWVLRRLKSRADFDDYARLKGYAKGWVFYQSKIYLNERR